MIYNWRSLLFVPALAQERWAKAHTRGADAIIVDLEDSAQPEAKAQARWLAPEAVKTLSQNGADVTVRVNNDPAHLEADIEAVVVQGLRAVVMPKVESAKDLAGLSTLIEAAEFEAGMERLQVKVIAVIESPRALENIREIADGPRVVGISLGSEDFALSLGRPPAPLSLALAAQTIAYAASARGLMGLAMAGSIANYTDLEAFAAEAKRSHAMGLTGAMCIHPNQVKVLNECFGASEAEIAEAKGVLAAWEVRTADVISHNGRMIDQPVVERARRLLSSQRR
ncbi:MAG TPA: CoA ester lyase [Hyphomonadaceae bacterium]|jgi:citrate lyase subunit beta/citryl-CoA lyase